MQIIQSIRDRGAAVVIVVISLSLIGFILMDSRSGSDNAANSTSSSIGKVDGEDIEIGEFNTRVQQAENMQAQRQQRALTTAETNQVREQMWEQMVAEKVFYKEAEKLGITLTSKELSAILLSNDPSNPFLQEQGMRDPTTGQLDMAKAQEALSNIKKLKGEQRDQVVAQVVDPLQLSTAAQKYAGLIGASAYYPSWMKEKDNKLNSQFATISYVGIPYSDISDSTIQVSDADVTDYVAKHKKLFKQEAGRILSYLTFSQLPTAADSAAAREQISKIQSDFSADTTTAAAFVARTGSTIDFADEFLPKSRIPSSFTDSILQVPQGTVAGPFIEQGNYVVAKVVGSKPLPDSVKARHILISMQDQQSGAQIRDAVTAKAVADSILKAINGGADFAALALQYSSDGSKTSGGDLGTFGYGQMVPEFNEFTFTKPVGSKDVVQTQFGYHVIDITSQSNFKPAYKIAFIGRQIIPSEQTISDASMAATKASSQKDATALQKYAATTGLGLTREPNMVKENDYNVGQLSEARQLVQWAFKADVGAVSEPFNIGDQFVVATLDKINKEGVQDAATARAGAEVLIRNKKKAEMIKAKLGTVTSLQDAATKYSKQVSTVGADSTITWNAQIVTGIGIEPKVQGAAFNPEYATKVSPVIEGNTGVYVIKVDGMAALATSPEEAAQRSAAKLTALRTKTNAWFESLRNQADVKDKRSKYF